MSYEPRDAKIVLGLSLTPFSRLRISQQRLGGGGGKTVIGRLAIKFWFGEKVNIRETGKKKKEKLRQKKGPSAQDN